MRLLLRANAHRPLEDTGLELASSPDTVGREQWQWHLRLDESAQAAAPDVEVDSSSVTLARSEGSSQLSLSTDPARVTGRLETMQVGTDVSLTREERELLALVVGRGSVLVERRHELGELDILVLEGDDPYEVSVERLGDDTAELAVARLEPTDAPRIAWVP